MKEEIVLPNYDHCILNLVTSILKYYNVISNHSSLENLDKVLQKKYKNVVLIVLDGMGEHILNNVSKNGFFNNHKLDCITSVYPSTTTAALNTYYSGCSPYETAWLGWSQYFKEYGRTVDMFSHIESYQHTSLENANLDVFEEIVKYKTIFEKIEEASPKIKAYEITPAYSDKRSKRSFRADTIEEVIDDIETLCKNPDEKFIFAYCDNPDSILHKYGTDSDEAKQYIIETENKIKEMYSKLSDDTVVIISADHGHKNIDKAYTLLDFPEIQECLIMPAYFESRFLSFWVKENMKEEFEKRFNKVFNGEYLLMTKEELLDKHILGYGKKHPKLDDFIGNYVALSVAGSVVRIESFLAEGKTIKKSTHCGLTRAEMEVPLIVIEPQ